MRDFFYIHTFNIYIYIYTQKRREREVDIYIHTYIHTYIYMCVCVCVSVCVCLDIYKKYIYLSEYLSFFANSFATHLTYLHGVDRSHFPLPRFPPHFCPVNALLLQSLIDPRLSQQISIYP